MKRKKGILWNTFAKDAGKYPCFPGIVLSLVRLYFYGVNCTLFVEKPSFNIIDSP